MSVQKKHLVTTLVLLVLLLLLLHTPTTIKSGDDLAIPESATIFPIGGLATGVQARQTFPPSGSMITSIALLLATYQRTNVGTFSVSLAAQRYDGHWETLANHTSPKERLQDNAAYVINFSPPVYIGEATQLALTLRADGSQDQAIAWWANSGVSPPGYQLSLNEQPLSGVARFTVRYEQPRMPFWRALPLLWVRTTPFLNSRWQAILLLSIACAAVTTLVIVYRSYG